MRDVLVQEIDEDGEIIHVEMKNREGEHLIGVYQLIGWTKPSKKVNFHKTNCLNLYGE